MPVLYRKYRPQCFADVIGQEHIVQTLKNAVAFNMVAHAYLFAGPRGTGKTSLARLLAKAVNCTGRKNGEGEPCLSCDSCIEIAKGNAIDLLELDAASNRGIDEIRELKEGVRFLPNKSKFRVFILDECHMLTKEAASALLKTLEEPPAHAIFILATTDLHKMISTILSRCQVFHFQKLGVKQLIESLSRIAKKENFELEAGVPEAIASQATGSLRDAQGLLDQLALFCGPKITMEDAKNILGLLDAKTVGDFVDLCVKKEAFGAVQKIDEIIRQGYDPHQFVKFLTAYARQMMLAKIDSSLMQPEVIVLTTEQQGRLLEQIKGIGENQLKTMVEILLKAGEEMKWSPIVQLPLEVATVEIIENLKLNLKLETL